MGQPHTPDLDLEGESGDLAWEGWFFRTTVPAQALQGYRVRMSLQVGVGSRG